MTDQNSPADTRDDGSGEGAAEPIPLDDRSGSEWVDDAAEARTGDDPRATAPRDKAGRPSDKPFDQWNPRNG